LSTEPAQPNPDPPILERMRPKTMIVGVLDLGTTEVESQQVVESRIRAALEHIAPEQLVVAPDCGMKYLPRRAAFEKLQRMASAAHSIRLELSQRVSPGGGV